MGTMFIHANICLESSFGSVCFWHTYFCDFIEGFWIWSFFLGNEKSTKQFVPCHNFMTFQSKPRNVLPDERVKHLCSVRDVNDPMPEIPGRVCWNSMLWGWEQALHRLCWRFGCPPCQADTPVSAMVPADGNAEQDRDLMAGTLSQSLGQPDVRNYWPSLSLGWTLPLTLPRNLFSGYLASYLA